MKRINEVFTDNEHEELKAVKGTRTWHDFIMGLVVEINNEGPKDVDKED